MKRNRGTPEAGLMKRIMAALSKKTDEMKTRIMIFFLLHRNSGFLMDKIRAFHVSGSQNHGRQRHSKYDVEDNNKFSYCNYVQQREEDDYGLVRGGDEAVAHKDEGGKSDFVVYMNQKRPTRAGGAPAVTEMETTIDDDVPWKVFAYSPATIQDTREADNDDDEEEDRHAATDLTDALFMQSEEEMKQSAEFSKADVSSIDQFTPPFGEDNGEKVDEEDIDQAADLFIQRFKRRIQLQKQLSLDRNTHMVDQMV